MQAYPVKIDDISSLGANEYNDLASSELNNFVQNSGQTLSGGDPSQMGVAAANYGSHGDFFTDSGSVNVYVLATQASKKGPNAYVDGMRVRFQVGNTNTAASTINVNSLGSKAIKQSDGSALTANLLLVNDFVTVFFDSANNFFILGETSASRNAQTMANTLENLGFNVSFGAGAMTIALKQKNGTADPTGSSPVKIAMRNGSQIVGGFNYRSIAAALSLVISSGSTLGTVDGEESRVYLYAIEDGSGGIELAASLKLFSEADLITTTAEGGAGAADDAEVIYSTTARTDSPLQLLGYIISTQTTAGTWAQTPDNLWVGREPVRAQPLSFYVHTGNDLGSVNTRIRRWSTIDHDNIGEYITYVDSATLGGSWTCIKKCSVVANYTEQVNGATHRLFGFSKNSSQLSTDILIITLTDVVSCGQVDGAAGTDTMGDSCATVELFPGDVLRGHVQQTSATNFNTRSHVRMTVTPLL